MDKIKILVAQHKPADVFHNNVYTPIHVGKAISRVNLNILGDDTGDNISLLNPYYCELTAQYWAWKNMPNVEYIGLCHYRRYFKPEFICNNIDQEMNEVDIILSRRIFLRTNVLTWLSNCLIPEDIALFYAYMSQKYKNNIFVFDEFYKHRNWINPANMFVCKKKLFDEFCEWQFGILSELRSVIPVSPYNRERRLMGYLAETLLPFFALERGLRIKEMPLVSMIGEKVELYTQSKWEIFLNNLLFSKRSTYEISPDILVGLKNDGLIDKVNQLFN